MKYRDVRFRSWFLFGVVSILAGCGSSGDEQVREPKARPPATTPQTTSLAVSIDAPRQYLASFEPARPGVLRSIFETLIATSHADAVFNATVGVATLDASGIVTEVVDASVTNQGTGVYAIALPGNLRVDRVIVSDLAQATELRVGQPLPAGALYVPAVNVSLRASVASTAAMQLLLDKTASFSEVSVTEVDGLLKAAEALNIPEPGVGELFPTYLERVKKIIAQALSGQIDLIDRAGAGNDRRANLAGSYFWDFVEYQSTQRFGAEGAATSVALAVNSDRLGGTQMALSGSSLSAAYTFLGDDFQRVTFSGNGSSSLEISPTSERSVANTQRFSAFADGSLGFHNDLSQKIDLEDQRFRVALTRTVSLRPVSGAFIGTSNRPRYDYGLLNETTGDTSKLFLHRIDTGLDVLIPKTSGFDSSLVQGAYGQVTFKADFMKDASPTVRVTANASELSINGSAMTFGSGHSFVLDVRPSSVSAADVEPAGSTGQITLGSLGEVNLSVTEGTVTSTRVGQVTPNGLLIYSRSQQAVAGNALHDLNLAVKLETAVDSAVLNGVTYGIEGLGFNAREEQAGDVRLGVGRLGSGQLTFAMSQNQLNASLNLTALAVEIGTQRQFDPAIELTRVLNLQNLAISNGSFSGEEILGTSQINYTGYIGQDGPDADSLPDAILMNLTLRAVGDSSTGETYLLVMSPKRP